MFTTGPRPLQPVWQWESWPPGKKRFGTGTIGGRLHLWRKQDPHQSSDSKTLEGIPPKPQRQRPSPMVIKETANYDIQITHRAQPATTTYVQQIKNRREWSLCLWSSPAKHWTCVAKLHTPLRSEDWDLESKRYLPKLKFAWSSTDTLIFIEGQLRWELPSVAKSLFKAVNCYAHLWDLNWIS